VAFKAAFGNAPAAAAPPPPPVPAAPDLLSVFQRSPY
jgi:hypothetical protein